MPNHDSIWNIIRGCLTPEEALGYTKGCILARIMRDGHEGEGRVMDRQHEANKVETEARMLSEAMAAYLATPDPMTTALDTVDMDPTVRDLAKLANAAGYKVKFSIDDFDADTLDTVDPPDDQSNRIAELERQLDEARQAAANATLESEELSTLKAAFIREREAHEAMRRELKRKTALISEAFSEFPSNIQTAPYLGLAARVAALRAELDALRDRYRPRRQKEEPAPQDRHVLIWYDVMPSGWWAAEHGRSIIHPSEIWTHQPPAPSEEGE